MRIAMIFWRCAAAAPLVWVAAIAIIEGGGSGCAPIIPQLLGSNEVPPNNTPGYGTASYWLIEDGTELQFTINAHGLSGPITAAHFHNAQASEDGPVVLDLEPIPKTCWLSF